MEQRRKPLMEKWIAEFLGDVHNLRAEIDRGEGAFLAPSAPADPKLKKICPFREKLDLIRAPEVTEERRRSRM
jgi:hypothetical protein